MSMANSLEVRVPLLDNAIIDFSRKVSPEMKIKGYETKYILRKAMAPYLPKKILWRKKKMGFPFPLSRFLAMNKNTFQPLLEKTNHAFYSERNSNNYDGLLKSDPARLWRMISTAVWADAFFSKDI